MQKIHILLELIICEKIPLLHTSKFFYDTQRRLSNRMFHMLIYALKYFKNKESLINIILSFIGCIRYEEKRFAFSL